MFFFFMTVVTGFRVKCWGYSDTGWMRGVVSSVGRQVKAVLHS